MLIIFVILIICIIIYLSFLSKYEVKYTYLENAYTKPKYSSHNYSSITFENGLKLILVQIDPGEEAGGAISFDYGYLDNKYDPGYIKLAFLSLIKENISNSEYLENYFGKFEYEIGKYYTSFYFQILGGGFQKYLKSFSELTYLEDDDERFNDIDNKNLDSYTNSYRNNLLEYLVYGYQNSKGEEIFPEGTNEIKEELERNNYEPIKNLMRVILSNPSKIKIVLYSHYKMSLMKKMALKFFKIIINKPKMIQNSKNNLVGLNAYNISDFKTKRIIYYQLDDDDHNYIRINYFLVNENISYNQLYKDTQYLDYIIYILNQTNEGSLYHQLNYEIDDMCIESLSCDYEIILKNRIKFSIYIGLNYYSYKYIPDIISKVYNYINNIILYTNNTLDDIRIEELDRISEQYFTFTEDAHESIFYKNMAIDLFYKDEKDFLLKQMWLTKQNFILNKNKVKNYYNQLNINNSVILLGLSNKIKIKHNLNKSKISFVFNNTKETKYYGTLYSLNDIDDYFNFSFENNYSMLVSPKENEFISDYDYNSELEYNSSNYDDYFKMNYEEINDKSNNYLKVFLQKDTSFHIPKVYIIIFFFHPFLRPNFQDEQNYNETFHTSKNSRLYFEYYIYHSYIAREIKEQLADAFRAGGNYYTMLYDVAYRGINLFIFSDKAKKALNIIRNIISNQTNFIIKLKKRFEIYRDSQLQFLSDLKYYYSFLSKIDYIFYEAITKNEKDNLPPIYNFFNFPVDSFENISLSDLNYEELANVFYSINYMYIFGYYNRTEAQEIYELYNSTYHFKLPLDIANLNETKLTESNFVEWSLYKSSITENSIFFCKTCNNYTSHFIDVTEYSLKNSCLIDMLTDILQKDENFINSGISIKTVKQQHIYLGFVFEKQIMENRELITKIFDWLEKNDKMTKSVDVIGDKFYYLFQGYKKTKNLKHYDIIDGGKQTTLQHLDKTNKDSDISDFKIASYKEFIEIIKKLIYQNMPFVKISPSDYF